MHIRGSPELKVWDPFVRIAHWTVALGFFVAYLRNDHPCLGGLHCRRAARCTRGVGFVGSTHARFFDFVTDPSRVIRHLWASCSRAPSVTSVTARPAAP